MTINVADYARECAAQGLRGDYSVCRSDFTVEQSYNYTADEQAVWRTLCDRQTKLTKRLAHRSYLDGVATLGLLDKIPDFGAVSEKLRKLTGWEIVAVPVLTQPVFADFMQMYGEKAENLIALGGDEMISRLYWYTVEYGLIREAGQPLKAFGAGLMSSFAELQFAIEGTDAHHVPFDLETVMRTSYEIDKFQRAYFVLPSFDVLRDAFQDVT